jgi:hypothetical protein
MKFKCFNNQSNLYNRCRKPNKPPVVTPTVDQIVNLYSAQDIYDSIFDGSNNGFFKLDDYKDLTHGITKYINAADPKVNELVKMQDGKLQLWVEQVKPVASDNSVKSIRVKSSGFVQGASQNSGIIVFSVSHCPCGDGIWPALWAVGPDWPNGGEIDVMEGCNSGALFPTAHTVPPDTPNIKNKLGLYNTSTLHTSSGCNSCGKDEYVGCPQYFERSETFGVDFNKAGGVYMCLLDTSGDVKILFFKKDGLPTILKDNKTPISLNDINNIEKSAVESKTFKYGCLTYFKGLLITINIAVGGDYPYPLYAEPSMVNCVNSIIANGGGKISDQAYWEIDYIKTCSYPLA